VSLAKERGVLVFAFGPRIVRAVTHLDVSPEACARAGTLLLEAIEAPS
jgi:threonine aldolase